MALDIFAANSNNNEFMNFIICDTISAVSSNSNDLCFHTSNNHDVLLETSTTSLLEPQIHHFVSNNDIEEIRGVVKEEEWKNKKKDNVMLGVEIGGRKKRRRKGRAKKNKKEEEESQRMTHIAVERNRRKQMNQHFSVLRSLMPSSYVQRGDQASIVGGTIEFVKELEQLLQSLEAQKLQLQQQGLIMSNNNQDSDNNINKLPFSESFMYPQIQYPCSQMPNNHSSKSKTTIGEIEVTLIETHANLRILTRRRTPSHLSKLVCGFHSIFLTILHINVTTMDPLVLYSISAKVEEQCPLTCVDDIAGAVHHMLRIIKEGTGPVLA